jgi:hypothetical protein
MRRVSSRPQQVAAGQPGTTAGQPHRIQVPGFVTGQEVGLGDVIKRVTRAVGIKPCNGCQRRAAALNRYVVFTGRKGR